MSDLPNLFPALDSATEAALRESITRFGVLVPVVRDQHGRTLDGHHRSRLADELGVKYRVDVVSVEDDEQAREIAATLNADRRQLGPDQLREIVASLREAGHSLRAIAGAVGVSHEKVRQELSTVNDLTVPDRVVGRDGKSRPTVVAAKNEREAERAQEALANIDRLPNVPVLDTKRAERIAREQQAEQRRAEPVEVTAPIPDGLVIRHGDFRTVLADLEDASVDAIITDPPYPREFINLFTELGQLAARVLKPTGVFAAMVGQSHLRDYMRLLDERLLYRWVGAYVVQGPRNRVFAAKVATGWKPILIYTRDDAEKDWLLDDTFTSTGGDKDHHDWGQSESGTAALVERLSGPGALVVDPFLGGGTTAVVCRALGRRFVGCDSDAAAVHSTVERLAA